jgi:N-acetylmuramoyl-L-alanine amidase
MAGRTHAHPDIYRRVPVATHGRHKPVAIVLHSTESPNRPGVSDVLAIPNFWRGQGLGYGAHLVIDGEGLTVKCALDMRICWAVAGANTGRLHVELIGYSRYSKADWDDQDRGLKQCAKWIAYWHEQHKIPLVLSTRAGVATHAMYSKAYGISDHTDPGPNFPLQAMLRRAKYYSDHGWSAAPND